MSRHHQISMGTPQDRPFAEPRRYDQGQGTQHEITFSGNPHDQQSAYQTLVRRAGGEWRGKNVVDGRYLKHLRDVGGKL
jgi:hypothetical protein